MFVYSTIILHANLQYAEIPKEDIPRVVENSYIPVLQGILQQPSLKAALNFTGVSLEILASEYPEVIDLLKEGIKNNKFELTGCGYSHPIFPLLPQIDAKKQIEFNLEVLKDVLNYKPKGFWPPELAYDPTMPKLLKENGFEYLFFDDELYNLSSPLRNDYLPTNEPLWTTDHYLAHFSKAKNIFQKINRFYKAYKGIAKLCNNTDFYPVELKGVKGTITGLKSPKSWTILTYSALLGYPLLTEKKVMKTLSRYKNHKGLVTLYSMDLEFFGYRSYVEGKTVEHSRLINMLERITKLEDVELVLPHHYLEQHKPKEIGYMKTGSWANERNLDIWTKDEDNAKLELLCDEVRTYFAQLGPDQIDRELWKLLLLAENSDGRGWMPIAERRLDCFSSALEAIEILRKKLGWE